VVDPQTDHDLLVRIDEQMKQMRLAFDVERLAIVARAVKQDSDFEAYKRDTALHLKNTDDNVESLRMSRAQFYAIAATISALIGIVIKVFWPR